MIKCIEQDILFLFLYLFLLRAGKFLEHGMLESLVVCGSQFALLVFISIFVLFDLFVVVLKNLNASISFLNREYMIPD